MAVPKEGLKRDLQNLFQSGPVASAVVAGGAKHTEALGSRKEAGTAGKAAGAPLGWGRTKGGRTDGWTGRGGQRP